MLKIEIHPNAAISFNEKADILFAKLKPPPAQPEDPGAFKPETFIAHHISGDDILKPPKMGLVLPNGKEIARYFFHEGQNIGLDGDDFEQAQRLAESFQKCKELSPLVSQKFMLDRIFDWIEQKYKTPSTPPMVNYVLEACPPHIKKNDIWIPISGLHVQSPLAIGRVVLKPMTKEMFDLWDTTAKTTASPPNLEKILQLIAQLRRQLQGLAAATIEVLAEPDRAQEIAFEETEAAISMLRFLESVNFEPEMVSYCAPIGHRSPAYRRHLVLDNGVLNADSQSITEHSISWVISDSDVASLNLSGLQVLSGLITREGELSEFDERLAAALMLYSRNSLERLPTGKLIYILSALESILLKNNNEGIEQNLGERMAFIIAKSVPDRRAVIANIKEIYHLRSQFLHHGITIENMAALRVFMKNAWVLFHCLLLNAGKRISMQHFFDGIERIKLS